MQQDLFPIAAIGSDGQPLAVGERVGFIKRGWFLPREQESFGIIESIDARGGIHIKVIEAYKCFISTHRLVSYDQTIYFTHHQYDATKRARIYSIHDGEHHLHVYRIEAGELDKKIQELNSKKPETAKPPGEAA